jgi:hypothetical protein
MCIPPPSPSVAVKTRSNSKRWNTCGQHRRHFPPREACDHKKWQPVRNQTNVITNSLAGHIPAVTLLKLTSYIHRYIEHARNITNQKQPYQSHALFPVTIYHKKQHTHQFGCETVLTIRNTAVSANKNLKKTPFLTNKIIKVTVPLIPTWMSHHIVVQVTQKP